METQLKGRVGLAAGDVLSDGLADRSGGRDPVCPGNLVKFVSQVPRETSGGDPVEDSLLEAFGQSSVSLPIGNVFSDRLSDRCTGRVSVGAGKKIEFFSEVSGKTGGQELRTHESTLSFASGLLAAIIDLLLSRCPHRLRGPLSPAYRTRSVRQLAGRGPRRLGEGCQRRPTQ